jgi:diguanylate cyclase (GGDEF)-like protein
MGRDERSRIGSADEARTPPASVPQPPFGSDRSCPLFLWPLPLFERSLRGLGTVGELDRSGLTDGAELAVAGATIAELLRAVEVNRHAALHDSLTGLANRSLIVDHLQLALARADRRSVLVAVLFVDLDDFKQINDTLGHVAGDELLMRVAERLRPAVRPTDTLGRWGGDEFVVVCEDLERASDGPVIVGRVAAAFEAPFAVAGTTLRVGASIGVAVSAGADQPATLIHAADSAMYETKRGHPARRRNGHQQGAVLGGAGLPKHERLTRHLLGMLSSVEVDDAPTASETGLAARVT